MTEMQKKPEQNQYSQQEDVPLVREGFFFDSARWRLNETEIYWPGGVSQKHHEFSSRWHVRVITAESVPYVYVFKNPQSRKMLFVDQFGKPETERSHDHMAKEGEIDDQSHSGTKKAIKCPGLRCTNDAVTGANEYCCFGYTIDLLIKLALSANFTFDLFYTDIGYGRFIEYKDLVENPEEAAKYNITLTNDTTIDGYWTG